MRIKILDIHPFLTEEHGLDAIKEINTSTNVIALVGKNGSGKSRILKMLQAYRFISHDKVLLELDELPDNITQTIDRAEKQKVKLDSTIITKGNEKPRKYSEQELKVLKLEVNKAAMAKITPVIGAHIKVINLLQVKEIERKLDSSYDFAELLSKESTSFTDDILTGSLGNHGLNYVKSIARNADAQQYNRLKGIKNRSEIELQKIEVLERYIDRFFGKKLHLEMEFDEQTAKSKVLLNNHEITLESLSPGERSLFALAILFTTLEINSKNDLSNCIIVIDEPETHLHPDAQIRILEELRKLVTPHGQLWIATHSIHIVSQLKYDEIFMVKDGKLFPPNRNIPGESLIELMGMQERVDELRTFISSISDWAYANFMVECFKDPTIIQTTDKNDIQLKEIQKVLGNSEVKVLDYGAGQGRIGQSLKEDETTRDRVKYSAFDVLKENTDFIEGLAISEAVYHSDNNLIPSNSFDLVILCNVLHEIPPQDWPEVFSTIDRALNENGVCLIVEDKRMPKGENAHEFGFLLMDESSIKKMFRNDPSIIVLENGLAQSQRILSIGIGKGAMSIALSNVIDALKVLKENVYEDVKILRQSPLNDAAVGRYYALKSQVFINVTLALDALNGVTTIAAPKTLRLSRKIANGEI